MQEPSANAENPGPPPQKPSGRSGRLACFVVLGLAVAFNVAWAVNTRSRLEQVRTRTAKYRSEVETLQRLLGENGAIGQERAELEQRMTVTERLREARIEATPALAPVIGALPPSVRLDALAWKPGETGLVVSTDDAVPLAVDALETVPDCRGISRDGRDVHCRWDSR